MSQTRGKILELGEDLIVTKGYNAFSYHDISKELGIKNAAVHYYFPAKENLGTSIVKNNILRFEEMVDNMKTKNFNEVDQLEAFFKVYAKTNRDEKICLIGSLSPDFNTLSEMTQHELKKMLNIIVNWLSGILKSGRKKGLFKFDGEPETRALMVLSTFVAGLQICRVKNKTDFKSIHNQLIKDITP